MLVLQTGCFWRFDTSAYLFNLWVMQMQETTNTERELVLIFHGVGEPHPKVDSEEKPYWLSRDRFTLLLNQILDLQTNTNTKISLTFDDGNASDITVALPELARRDLTASFFVCANRIGKQHYLSDVMIRELLGAGMRVGSHGMDHRDWRMLDEAGLRCEISEARHKLEDVIQRPVTRIAIPFGSYDRRVLSWLERERWDVIYTSDRGTTSVTSKFKPRTSIKATMRDDEILYLLRSPHLHDELRKVVLSMWKRWR
jgi:peptidoglycan/xylan/chitin deacetylase (PgdA/CDA1 family)